MLIVLLHQLVLENFDQSDSDKSEEAMEMDASIGIIDVRLDDNGGALVDNIEVTA